MNPNPNPLLTTLEVLQSLVVEPLPAAELCERHELTERSVKRHVAEARHLGAEIESQRGEGGRYRYVCVNADLIEQRGLLRQWLELERARTVI